MKPQVLTLGIALALSACATKQIELYPDFDGGAAQEAGTPSPDAMAVLMGHIKDPPPSLEDVRGKRYQSASADWAASPWQELRFSIPQTQCYAYSYASEGAGGTAKATAFAKGDLDGDGTAAVYSITIAPDAAFRAQIGAMVKDDPDE